MNAEVKPIANKHAAPKSVKKSSAAKKQLKTAGSVTPKAVAVTVDTLIIGAGFAGLGTAIQLQKNGEDNFLILERATAVGGTWRDNQYPGAACDIPSHLYSFSFAPNHQWSNVYSGSAEILQYIRGLVSEFQLQDSIRFGCNVTHLAFDESTSMWNAHTADGQCYRAKAVVAAQGPLSNASLPSIKGIETFKGEKIHSAQWNHHYDFTGKRVAVVGTGASAVQIIPELVKKAEHVTVFQRTPAWVLPRAAFNTPEWSKSLFSKLPVTQSAFRKMLYTIHESVAAGLIWNTPVTAMVQRIAQNHLKRSVNDSWMQRQLTPDFTIGCKRVLMSNDYYPALQKPNAKLITWPIANISRDGIRTAEGIEHQVDCIVFATGFDVCLAGTPFPITGIGGRQLNTEWQKGANAYKSINVSGYPNLFFTFGPNSGPGHNSALVYMEAQINYIVQGVQLLSGGKIKRLNVKAAAQERYNQKLQKRLSKTNWNSGCSSWYLTEDGFNPSMYPGFATQYAQQMRTLKLSDYN